MSDSKPVFPWDKGAEYRARRLFWLLLSVAILAADRVTKLAILAHFFPGDVKPVTSFFSLILTWNPGAAFSFLANAGGAQKIFFIAVSIIASLALCWLILRSSQKAFSFAAALIIGGALGNLWDRIQYGRVVDFLLFHLGQWNYPAFNVADSAIVVGAVLLILDGVRLRKYQ